MKYLVLTTVVLMCIVGCQLSNKNDKVTVETKLDSVIQSYDSINRALESEIVDTKADSTKPKK